MIGKPGEKEGLCKTSSETVNRLKSLLIKHLIIQSKKISDWDPIYFNFMTFKFHYLVSMFTKIQNTPWVQLSPARNGHKFENLPHSWVDILKSKFLSNNFRD